MLLTSVVCALVLGACVCSGQLTSFPDYFKFGSATAAYQTEGGWDADGKGENIWDRTVHQHPDKIIGQATGDVAADSYHKYKEDVQMVKNVGMDFYRFSISWSRVMPNGDTSKLNEPGLQYYDNLIDELIANGIEPIVTMYHWDMPQPLQEIGGMTNPEIIWYFELYADVLYKRYGDRIKTWITFNEPTEICDPGYGEAERAPLVYAPGIGNYLCSYHLLLANAKMYDLYKEKYSAFGARVGITLSAGFYFPKDPNNVTHVAAAEKAMQFETGLYAHPIFSKEGGYPQLVSDIVDARSKRENRAWSRLPKLSEEQKLAVRGKSDFFGLNYYTSKYIAPIDVPNRKPGSWSDQEIVKTADPAWPRGKSVWLYSVPEGLRKLLNWISREYNYPEILITENGWSDDGELQDLGRIEYLKSHLTATLDAINDGCNITAHTTWSIMDNFQWMEGYSERFGIYHVNFDDPERPRTPKASVTFLRETIRSRKVAAN